MKQHIQNTLLRLAILLILTAFSANADTAKTTTAKIRYGYYYHFNDLREQEYYRLLPHPTPAERFYHTRMIATADIDDTPEKEDIVIIVVDTKRGVDFGDWHQAFLLITNTNTGKLERKALFKLFDTGTPQLNVPIAKVIELHNPSFATTELTDVSFKLVDLTGDGTLDVWVESAHGVALISFENGEFQEVLTNYTVTRKKLAEAADIEYYWYNVPADPQGEKYHRFLATRAPKERYYNTRMTATANVDDTPEKETIVLMTADTGREGPRGEWIRAFLLIAETEADVPKRKELFKLFDVGTHAFDVPAKIVEIQNGPFVFRELGRMVSHFYNVSFELVDLTGDGILDIWVECANGVAVISFQNGEFKAVCSAYTSIRAKNPEYIDLDNDGIYEIKIHDRISIDADMGSRPEWVNLYAWDGTTYVLNNRKFYAENDEFLIRILDRYNSVMNHYGRYEEYSFYIGLVYYYRDNAAMARGYLQWVIEHGKKQDYIQAAEAILKKLPPL